MFLNNWKNEKLYIIEIIDPCGKQRGHKFMYVDGDKINMCA